MKRSNSPSRLIAKRKLALEQVNRRLLKGGDPKKLELAKYEKEILEKRIDGAVGGRSSRRNSARRGVPTQ